MKLKSKQLTLSSANPTKWSDTLKQFVGSSRTIKPQIKNEDQRFSFSRTDIKPCPQLLSSFHLRLLRKYSYSIKPFRGSCFFSYFIYNRVFLSVAYLTVANLARLGIPVHCYVSVRYIVRLLSQCCITGGHTIQPTIEVLLPPTGIEPTLFRNSSSKIAGLQVHATTPAQSCLC